ncbi:hypothetical protein FHW69_003195 [Luteibacter sp. Sphag1AF]|uniref:hypothetical protein n=1 Tax=Luteibacter sp. Sphag1AF TaxID=2587031 RepID=UPI00160AD3DD|nr:hypothetical protein [Luteibacter sp. Sphag1AF]MBB3228553.1 hypothetical protein [Luteibacter sp. Sphag1AF]
MKLSLRVAAVALSLAVSGAWAQSASQPLNLKLPPSDFPPPASTAPPATPSTGTAASGSTATATGRKDPPGTYYGDQSTRIQGDDLADGVPRCDDATYNKPEVHGSLTAGVVSSSRGGSGNYQAGAVNLSQRFGDCSHPTGGISISIGTGTGSFSGGRGR